MSANNSRREIAYVVESVFGTTPSTPSTKLIDHTEFSANFNAEQLNDPSIRANRQVVFSRRGNLSAEGSIGVAFAPDVYDDLLEAVFQGTWNSNVLKIGTTQRSFAFEERFTDLGQYQVWNGVTFNTFELSMNTDALVTANFGFMGSSATALSGTSIDATPDAVVEMPRFFHAEGSISEGGSPVAFITSMQLSLDNGLTGNRTIGNVGYRSISSGKATVTGTVTALFESADLFNKFRNSTDSVISVVLSAGSPAETLTFKVPKVRYTSGNFQRGADGPVLVELGFTGTYDATDATSLMVTRSA